MKKLVNFKVIYHADGSPRLLVFKEHLFCDEGESPDELARTQFGEKPGVLDEQKGADGEVSRGYVYEFPGAMFRVEVMSVVEVSDEIAELVSSLGI